MLFITNGLRSITVLVYTRKWPLHQTHDDPFPGPHLFVVDDEKIIAETWGLIMRNAGYDATAFCSPLEALRSVAVEAPMLLITDVRMPEMSGATLALRAGEIAPGMKALLISGMAATDDLMERRDNVVSSFRSSVSLFTLRS